VGKAEYLKDLEEYYTYRELKGTNWSLFNCCSLYISWKQLRTFIEILKDNHINPASKRVLDIGSGNGDFILNLLKIGFRPANITAVEYLGFRYEKLRERLPHIRSVNGDFLQINLPDRYDLITLLAVLTSITDNTVRYKILEKALKLLKKEGILVLYDFFDDREVCINRYYRPLSLRKVREVCKGYEINVYDKVYLNMKIIKILCKFHLEELIPILEKLKFLNSNYHFVVIRKR